MLFYYCYIVPLVQSLSFFQSVLHSGEQLINNYKALMSPFHIKLFVCIINRFAFIFLLVCLYTIYSHTFIHSLDLNMLNILFLVYSVSINFLFLSIIHFIWLSIINTKSLFSSLLLYSFAHFNTLSCFIFHLLLLCCSPSLHSSSNMMIIIFSKKIILIIYISCVCTAIPFIKLSSSLHLLFLSLYPRVNCKRAIFLFYNNLICVMLN